MQKIGEFIYETDQLLGIKSAFVPASAISGGGGGGAQQPQQAQPQEGQPQGGQPAGGQPQGGGGGQSDQMMQQVMQMVQQLPPEIQGEAQQAIQQVQQLPPDQQPQALQQIQQGIQQMMQQGGGQPQGGQPGQPGQEAGGQVGQTGGDAPGSANPQGHVQAENQLDNTKVTLTVRELMDLTSGGSATKSLLAVKQLADSHNQKMQANQQKAQQTQQQAQAEQAMAAQGAQGGGGLYSQAPDMSGKAPQQPGQGQPR